MKGRLENKIKTENSIHSMIVDMPDYMNRFYYSLSNKTHATKKMYIENVIRFLRQTNNGVIPSTDDLNDIDTYKLQLYIAEISLYHDGNEYKEMKASTQCAIYSALSAFFRFCEREGYIKENPLSHNSIERPTVREKEITFLRPDEVRMVEAQIFNGAGNAMSIGKQKKWKYRDLLLFRIPVVNGLRVTALSEINIEDIDFKNKKITVTEKGNITKKVDFDYKTENYMKIWIKQRAELMDGNNSGPLFISNQRTRMTVRSIENVIKKYTKSALNRNITPHNLRSTCGTNTYQEKKDIYLVSKILGHRTTSPTRRYAAVFNEDITDTINTVAKLY